MAIEFHCPVCGESLRVDDDAVGEVVRCGGCLSMLRVPNPETASPAFPDAPETPFNDLSQPSPAAPPPPPPRPLEEPPREKREEPGRPPRRSRVRREPVAPPPGTSPLVWAILTFCVVGVGFCILCCGTGISLQGLHWRLYQSAKGGFQVELPASPRKVMTLSGLQLKDPSWTIEGTRVVGSGDEYAVLYKDIGPRNFSDEQLLAQMVVDFENGLGKQQVQVDKQFNDMFGFAARELTFHNRGGSVYVFRLIVADNRIYMPIVGGSESLPDPENIQHFFNSFALTDPNVIKIGKERKEKILKSQQEIEERKKRLVDERKKETEEKKKLLAEAKKIMDVAQKVVDVSVSRASEDQAVAQVAALGSAVAEAPMRTVKAEHERLERQRVAELGRELASNAMKIVAGERERAEVAALGSSVAVATVNVANGEQERLKLASELAHRAELENVRSLGIAIGSAVTSAIENARADEQKR